MRVAVVGGGLGGLVAAHGLVSAGFDAHVLEAAPAPGGVIGTSIVDGFVREHAASSFLGGPSRGALALCQELGIEVEAASPRAKTRWIYIDGKLRALPRNPIDFLRSDLLTWRGKLALLREPLAPRKGTEDESIHAFAARRFGAEAARAIVAPFVTGIFAADSHAISLEAGFPRLAQFDAEGGVVRSAAKQVGKSLLVKLSGKRTAKTPSGMWAPAGGLGSLVEALTTKLGPRIRTHRRIRTIAPAPATAGVLVDNERWDAVVLATPAHEGASLVDDAMPELASRLRVFERAPVALVYLGLPADSVPRASDGFGFLTAQGEDLRVLGVVFESTVWSNRAPEGQALLRCIFGGGRDPDATKLTDAELIEHALRDVAKAFASTKKSRGAMTTLPAPTHASVIRWSHGIAQYPVGHRDYVRAAVAAGRVHRIALAGADYRGAGVNDLCADRDVIVSELRTWS
ncbi:MAG TPA: protoporphyrinogen oxidase [Kofleriaceae bacterium]|nr:protoporphyrinogen oxidase [Kofleriaceae bacterium]